MLRSTPNSMFMGSALPHTESIKGSIRLEVNPPTWNLRRSVHNISKYATSNPHPHPHLMDGPNGVPLFCTARGCRLAHVSESEYMRRGSGIQRRGGNGEAAGDENSKSSRDMLEANPGNPLLLSSYAKFLHKVQHNMAKAEEYYEMGIFASPVDAEVVSVYAKFIWETHKDAARAEAYFEQALNLASPDDCYVVSSYAHFLWNSEDE